MKFFTAIALAAFAVLAAEIQSTSGMYIPPGKGQVFPPIYPPKIPIYPPIRQQQWFYPQIPGVKVLPFGGGIGSSRSTISAPAPSNYNAESVESLESAEAFSGSNFYPSGDYYDAYNPGYSRYSFSNYFPSKY